MERDAVAAPSRAAVERWKDRPVRGDSEAGAANRVQVGSGGAGSALRSGLGIRLPELLPVTGESDAGGDRGDGDEGEGESTNGVLRVVATWAVGG